jgi:hypothetical protein
LETVKRGTLAGSRMTPPSKSGGFSLNLGRRCVITANLVLPREHWGIDASNAGRQARSSVIFETQSVAESLFDEKDALKAGHQATEQNPMR